MPRHDIRAFCGVVPALFTPFKADGTLDLAALRRITRHLVDRGVHGLYLTGSTGESFMMSPDERKQVVETAIDEVNGAIPCVVHIGAVSTYLTADLARHAEAAGADGVSSVPPIYWNFSADQIVNYYRDITAASSLPMIAYNVPMAALGFDLLKRLGKIEGVVGVKYTATTHFDILRLKQDLGDDFLIWSGADEMAVSGLGFGADGIIGSFYNCIPEIFLKIFDAVKAGEQAKAQQLQAAANAVIFETLSRAPLAAMKQLMALAGADPGHVRAPHDNLDAAGVEDFKARLRSLRDRYQLKDLEFLAGL